jgi:GDPmannose 4,6-dehydratase
MPYNASVPTLITGATGQDGSYLCEMLAQEGSERLSALFHPDEQLPPYISNLNEQGRLELVPCDLADPAEFRNTLRTLAPERVFHLAAISEPAACERNPALSQAVNVTSVEVLLEWLRREQPEGRVLVASSAAIFGDPEEAPQNEDTAAMPTSVYGEQKLKVRELAWHARKSGLFAACAILYNHESPRRPESYVFAKVINSIARIRAGKQEQLLLGNTRVRRDWGYAPEYVTAMAWMLDILEPQELIIASGESHSVQDLVNATCALAEIDPAEYVSTDPDLIRADDAPELRGDISRAWRELGWEPSVKFADLVRLLYQDAVRRLA